MKSAVFALSTFVFACVLVEGQELTKAQTGPWSALEKQVGLGMDREWDAMESFTHPKLSIWGDNLPTPIHISTKAYEYFTKLEDAGDEVVAHHLVPVSIAVVDDVAIINAYHHVATKDKDGETEETIYRLHNTWKKHDGQWKLLATYNTIVPSTNHGGD